MSCVVRQIDFSDLGVRGNLKASFSKRGIDLEADKVEKAL